ncbi:MAG: hypothetical protein HYT62_01190 [Candidatus Yanofskybacteria bacterium]|nr:hypothetical protein [Candidatus Yanofskybacteria bacterium]
MYRWDEDNFVFFSEAYVPNFQTIIDAQPRRPLQYRRTKIDFRSRDEALAWTLSAYARRLAWHWRYEIAWEENAFKIPFETWVLGPPISEGAQLAEWFPRETPNTDYRLMIHYNPRRYDGFRVPPVWPTLYSILKGEYKKTFPIRHRRLEKGEFSALKKTGEAFLAEVLSAYEHGRDAVDQAFRASGHRYWFSLGLPIP